MKSEARERTKASVRYAIKPEDEVLPWIETTTCRHVVEEADVFPEEDRPESLEEGEEEAVHDGRRRVDRRLASVHSSVYAFAS
jgi:hypothetical protein